MLYVRIANEDGTISFRPLRENNIYVQWETCGSMVPVDDPINFIAEMADMGTIMDMMLLIGVKNAQNNILTGKRNTAKA